MDNLAVDIALYFDTPEKCDAFIRIYDDMAETISRELRVAVDELYDNECPQYCQLVGTADDFPGKKALTYLSEIPGVDRIEIWYEGGDRDMGQLFFTPGESAVDCYYLPFAFKPEGEYDCEKISEAYDKHKVMERIALENMWE